MKKPLLLFAILLSFRSSADTDSLRRVAGKLPRTDTSLTLVYGKLAWAYLAANDTANTLRYLREGLALAEEQRYDRGVIAGDNNLALYYTRFGAIDSSIKYFGLGLAKAKEIKDPVSESKSCNNLAGAYLSKGDYAEAIRYYLEAMPYLEQLNDRQKIAGNYHCLGIAYYLLKNYPLSLKYYNLSLATGVKMGTPDKTGYNYNGIGVVYKEMKRYDSAVYYLDLAHTDAERDKDAYLLSHNLSDLGEVYSLRGGQAEALKYLDEAAALQRQNSDQHGLAATEVLQGNAFLAGKDYFHAIDHYDSAKALANAIGARDALKNAWKGLAEAYKALGAYGNSLVAYERYAGLKDSIYTEESSRQVAEMQTKYNTEKKEKDNILLQHENTVKDLQLSRERNLKYMLVISFAAIVIISAIYYNRYRLQQKNKLLKEREARAYAVFQAQEDEKGRLSKELHDGVGALLSLVKLNMSSIDTDESNEKILKVTKELTTKAIKEVRTISHDLMPGVLVNAGLEAAIREMLESVNTGDGLVAELAYSLPGRYPADMERNLFRIAQEATNNILKHSGATKEAISLSERNNALHMTIEDNGRGFDKNLLDKITGNGLNNIFSRVNVMNGTTDISTGPSGTRIMITIPLKNTTNG